MKSLSVSSVFQNLVVKKILIGPTVPIGNPSLLGTKNSILFIYKLFEYKIKIFRSLNAIADNKKCNA